MRLKLLKTLDADGLLSLWARWRHLPGGSRLFSAIIGRSVPYTATIGAIVRELSPGRSRLELRDRASVRNHLGSIHAIALANLAEEASGLALITALAPHQRAILVGLSMEYTKKARGLLSAVGSAPYPAVDGDVEALAELRDEAGDVVARATARWRVGSKRG